MKPTFKAKHIFAALSILSLLLIGFSSNAQEKNTVTGLVKDPTGNPLSGVTVREKGSKAGGIITDDQGRFSIKASPNATLILSSVGYVTQEIKVGSGNTATAQ